MLSSSSLRTLARQATLSKAFHRPSRHYASQPKSAQSRMDRFTSRMPRMLRRYLEPLRNAPMTHISAFLILHELTAVVPLFGLAGAFHYYNYLPPYISEGKWVSDGVEKFGNYFRRKGWLEDASIDPASAVSGKTKWWGKGEGGVRVVVEFATAYAITKALLPLRLVLSVWGTPWFARVTVVPLKNTVSRLFSRGSGKMPAVKTGSGAARPAPSNKDLGNKELRDTTSIPTSTRSKQT